MFPPILSTVIILFWFLIPPALTVLYGAVVSDLHMAANALLTAACLIAFGLVQCKYRFLPRTTAYAVQLFFLLSLWIGKALRGYNVFPPWDTLLHFLSGILLVAVGCTVYRRCRGNLQNRLLLKLFVLFFAMGGAVLWEVYEFALDRLFHMASQNNSLTDTMWDMIAGTVGAVLAAFFSKKRSS